MRSVNCGIWYTIINAVATGECLLFSVFNTYIM